MTFQASEVGIMARIDFITVTVYLVPQPSWSRVKKGLRVLWAAPNSTTWHVKFPNLKPIRIPWWPPWHTLIDIPYWSIHCTRNARSCSFMTFTIRDISILTCWLVKVNLGTVISIWSNHHKNQVENFQIRNSENKPPYPIKYFHISWKLFIYSLGLRFINSLRRHGSSVTSSFCYQRQNCFYFKVFNINPFKISFEQ